MVQCWGKRSKVARVSWVVKHFLAAEARTASPQGRCDVVLQSAVHIPCCPSFRWNPLNWRGVCFGRQVPELCMPVHIVFHGGIWCGLTRRFCQCRSFMECYWFSVDRTRWSRTTHALRLGREYTEPFQGFGKGDKHEISSLCERPFCMHPCMNHKQRTWEQLRRSNLHQSTS